MRKDRDTMSDVGGRHRPAGGQKPERSDLRKPKKKRLMHDEDFDDTLRDPDLHPSKARKRRRRDRKSSVDCWLAEELLKIANMLLEDEGHEGAACSNLAE